MCASRIAVLLGTVVALSGLRAQGPARGVVIGVVTGADSQPVAGAVISAGGSAEVRSGDDGRFTLRDVPSGKREIEVRLIGMMPLHKTIDVLPGDTTRVAVSLSRVATLEGVRVTARTASTIIQRDIEERRKLGLGRFRDSTDIARLPNTPAIFDGMAGVRVKRGIGSSLQLTNTDGCRLAMWINRLRSEPMDVYLLTPDAIATIEVYTRDLTTPDQFKARGHCGAVVVWTKRFFQ